MRSLYKEGSLALVAFNLTGRATRQFVTVNVRTPELPGLPQDLTVTHLLLDDRGGELPVQRVDVSSMPSNRLGFIAELPPLGYRVFTLVLRPEGLTAPSVESLVAGDTVLENNRYRLTLDPASGAIAGLYDRARALEVFSGPAAAPILFEDRGNALGGRRYDRMADGVAFVPTAITRSHHGPLMAALRVESALQRDGRQTGSTLVQEFRLYRDLDQVRVRVKLHWQERGLALKLAFPVQIKLYAESTAEIPYGTQMYPSDGTEVPGQSWVDVTGESNFTERSEKLWHGVTIANTAKYSYAFE